MCTTPTLVPEEIASLRCEIVIERPQTRGLGKWTNSSLEILLVASQPDHFTMIQRRAILNFSNSAKRAS